MSSEKDSQQERRRGKVKDYTVLPTNLKPKEKEQINCLLEHIFEKPPKEEKKD